MRILARIKVLQPKMGPYVIWWTSEHPAWYRLFYSLVHMLCLTVLHTAAYDMPDAATSCCACCTCTIGAIPGYLAGLTLLHQYYRCFEDPDMIPQLYTVTVCSTVLLMPFEQLAKLVSPAAAAVVEPDVAAAAFRGVQARQLLRTLVERRHLGLLSWFLRRLQRDVVTCKHLIPRQWTQLLATCKADSSPPMCKVRRPGVDRGEGAIQVCVWAASDCSFGLTHTAFRLMSAWTTSSQPMGWAV